MLYGDISSRLVTVTIVDDFEDGDLSEYSGDTSGFSVDTNAPVFHGSYSLKNTTTNFYNILSESGLPTYPARGDTIKFNAQMTSSSDRWEYAWAWSNSGNNYSIRADGVDGDLALRVYDGGTETIIASDTSVTFPTSEWMLVTIDYQSPTITVTLEDASGTQVTSISADDSTHASGGIQWLSNPASNSTGIFFDWLRLV